MSSLIERLSRIAAFLGVKRQARVAYFETIGRLFPNKPGYRFYRVEKVERRNAKWTGIVPKTGIPSPSRGRPDILIGGISDWYFRKQRPQHLARGFAAQGHRVFYLTTRFIDSRKPGFKVDDLGDYLFVVRLSLEGAPDIFTRPPRPVMLEQLKAGAALLLNWAGCRGITSVVQHPFWFSLVRDLPGNRIIYDCMDHHDGFGNNTPAILELEQRLIHESDLVVTSSARQEWSRRAEDYLRHISDLPEPKVSVIVVTYNNLDFTKACLESIVKDSEYDNLEVIVVDNASTDETPSWLLEYGKVRAGFKTILNDANRGFPAACNQGLEAASGDYLVLHNNDTVVTPGWIRTFTKHLKRDASIGLIGPLTNNIGNEARVGTRYTSLEDMVPEARSITLHRMGRSFDIRTLGFYCVMMPRGVFEKAGPLDERFGLGFFEDDDYCRRVGKLGYRIVCAEDVFIHHHLSATFDQFGTAEKRRIFEENRRRYEAKWGRWVPHLYRSQT